MHNQIEHINKTAEFDLRKKFHLSRIIKLFRGITEWITKELVVYYGKYAHRNIIENIQIRKY